ncbi:MAG: fibronectin type III domain-containing protein, partial [Bdellovibrionales bacterium]|nr:fibronectin type III domain-containing protein [Bdellovibrionales bacterium]
MIIKLFFTHSKLIELKPILLFLILSFLSIGCKLNDNSLQGEYGSNLPPETDDLPPLLDPPVLQSLDSQVVSDTEIKLTWNSTGSGNFIIAYQIGSTPPSDCESGTIISNVSSSPYTVSGLNNNNTYSFKVCGTNGKIFSTGRIASAKTMTYCGYRKDRVPYANSGDSGIDGSTENKAFTICTSVQLTTISSNLDKYFKLVSDIDLSDVSTPPHVTGSFTGTFDGQGHLIKYFTGTSLFNQLGTGGVIKNIGMVGASSSTSRGLLAEVV